MSMKSRIATGFISTFLLLPIAWAHHSFAVYDFMRQIEFSGTVESLNFRNPHVSMTLRVTNAEGVSEIINFVEGAPANMLARQGLRPELLQPGVEITAFGSPLLADPSKIFLRKIVLSDGREFQ